MIKLLHFKRFIFISILLNLSCDRYEIVVATDLNKISPEKILNIRNYILNLGFANSDIIENESNFVVEGDIGFSKFAQYPVFNPKKLETRQSYQSLVNYNNQKNIKVRLDNSLSFLANEVNVAINLWNSVGSNTKFSVVSVAENVLIRVCPSFVCGCGYGLYPVNGSPGTFIDLKNVATFTTLSFNKRVTVIAHELGHIVGLRHTNEGGGTPVPGYGGSDPSSIMNSGSDGCNFDHPYLSTKDQNSFLTLYPTLEPKNLNIMVGPSQFNVSWNNPIIISDPSVVLTGFDLQYSGFSGVNFGSTISLGQNVNTFTVPGVDPYPANGSNQTGGIQVKVWAKYNNGVIESCPTVYRNKVNGVWQ